MWRGTAIRKTNISSDLHSRLENENTDKGKDGTEDSYDNYFTKGVSE